jgi:hypothetical protein
MPPAGSREIFGRGPESADVAARQQALFWRQSFVSTLVIGTHENTLRAASDSTQQSH